MFKIVYHTAHKDELWTALGSYNVSKNPVNKIKSF